MYLVCTDQIVYGRSITSTGAFPLTLAATITWASTLTGIVDDP
jgi:hypothetical protein